MEHCTDPVHLKLTAVTLSAQLVRICYSVQSSSHHKISNVNKLFQLSKQFYCQNNSRFNATRNNFSFLCDRKNMIKSSSIRMEYEGLEGKGVFVTKIYQCRLCGSIIPKKEGVERHGQNCRPPEIEITTKSSKKFNQMAFVSFPCPIVLLRKLHSNLSQKYLSLGKQKYDTQLEASAPRCKALSDTDYDRESDSDADEPKRKTNVTCARKDPNNPYPCPLKGCDSKLKSRGQLKMHFILHLENNPYACPIPGCNLKLGAQCHFKRHMEWHMGKNIISCKKCGQEYSRLDKLKNHICSQKHPRPDANRRKKKSLEDTIDYLRSRYKKLKEKGLLLFDQDNSDAEEIGFDFNYKIDINAIIKTDPVFLKVREENPSFEKLIFERDHGDEDLKVKKKDKNYKCEFCVFTCGSLRTLKDHYSSKHSHRPWCCAKCGLTFKMEVSLKEHMKFHRATGNNIYLKKLKSGKFQCTKCGFVSKYEVSVKRHWLLKHKVSVPCHKEVLPKVKKISKKKNRPRSLSTKFSKQKSAVDVEGPCKLSLKRETAEQVEIQETNCVSNNNEEEIHESVEVTTVKTEPGSDKGLAMTDFMSRIKAENGVDRFVDGDFRTCSRSHDSDSDSGNDNLKVEPE